jgi:hypothetical protein
VACASAATIVAALSFDAIVLPSAPTMVVVTVTDAEAVDWFCTSVLTDTVADASLTVGVVTKTPLCGAGSQQNKKRTRRYFGHPGLPSERTQLSTEFGD